MSISRLVDASTVLAGLSALALTVVVLTGGDEPIRAAAPGPIVEDWEQFLEGGRTTGASQPSVTIIEFGDYECSFCVMAFPHLEAILAKYPDDVQLVYHHTPLVSHSRAYQASRAAECAGAQGNFWAYHRLLYVDRTWVAGALETRLLKFAEDLGVRDLSAFAECLAETSPLAAVDVARTHTARLGFRGTPSFLVNGQKHLGVLDTLAFEGMYASQIR